eukprot:833331-Prymnesium_polylepis.1
MSPDGCAPTGFEWPYGLVGPATRGATREGAQATEDSERGAARARERRPHERWAQRSRRRAAGASGPPAGCSPVGKSSVTGTFAGSPYTVADDEKTISVQPASRMHSTRLSVPCTLTWTQAYGPERGRAPGDARACDISVDGTAGRHSVDA